MTCLELKNKRNMEWKKYRITGDRRIFDKVFAEVSTQKNSNYMMNSFQISPLVSVKNPNLRKSTNYFPKILHHCNHRLQIHKFKQNFSPSSNNDNTSPRSGCLYSNSSAQTLNLCSIAQIRYSLLFVIITIVNGIDS